MEIKCKKCLLEELDRDEYTENLMEYIKNFPEDKRAEERIYNSRLEICKNCDELYDGMCRICGCYVQLRALKKNMYCPSEHKKW